MFLLQFHFDFSRNPSQWSDVLNSDPAYLNAVLSASHAYFDCLSGFDSATVHQGRPSYHHLSRCLQLLRARLADEHDKLKLADTTIMAILCLTSYSNRLHQDNHLQGLHKIIELRGGLKSMRRNPKLLIETFRCDITLALNSGRDPIFFHNTQSEPFLPYLDQLSGFLPPDASRPLPASSHGISDP